MEEFKATKDAWALSMRKSWGFIDYSVAFSMIDWNTMIDTEGKPQLTYQVLFAFLHRAGFEKNMKMALYLLAVESATPKALSEIQARTTILPAPRLKKIRVGLRFASSVAEGYTRDATHVTTWARAVLLTAKDFGVDYLAAQVPKENVFTQNLVRYVADFFSIQLIDFFFPLPPKETDAVHDERQSLLAAAKQ